MFPLATGCIKILPVPLYTFTNPSPFIIAPINDFEERSTVNFKLSLQAKAKFPSIRIISSFNSISINSVFGVGDSNTAYPDPDNARLNKP